MEWLYKSRTAYWEIENPGKRYKALRIIKNKAGEHAGKYTMEAVASRVEDMNIQAMRNVESGAQLSQDYLDKCIPLLVADLGLTMEQFNTTEKIRAPKPEPEPEPEKKDSAPTLKPEVAVRRERKPRTVKSADMKDATTVTTSKKENDGISAVVNHTLEPMIVTIENGEIHIWEDGKENLKKPRATWVAPADDIGRGAKLVPRTTPLK